MLQKITSSIPTKTCLNERREIMFPLGQVYHHTKDRQYLKTIKHNLSLQKATFKPLFASGRGMVGCPSLATSTSNYSQSKLNNNFSAWSLNYEKQESAHKYLIVST
jgi:lantibiotic modifying enzyme